MIRKRLLLGGLLVVASLTIALVAGSAQASPSRGMTNAAPHAAAPSIPTPSYAIFSNLGAGGAYQFFDAWCVTDVLAAPTNGCGHPFTTANGFVGNGTRLTQIDVALTNDNGPNNATVMLAQDDGSGGPNAFGLPGAVIRSWSVASQPPFGGCCAVTSVTASPSIPVGNGKRYWVVVAPGPNIQTTTSDAWNWNVFDSGGPTAQNHGAGWFRTDAVQGAFDVLACPKICKVT